MLAVTVPPTGGTPLAVNYTDDEDFSRGRLSWLEYTSVAGQRQPTERSAALNFLRVPNNEGNVPGSPAAASQPRTMAGSTMATAT